MTAMQQFLTPLFEHDIGPDGVRRTLSAVRRHLGMDVAFLSHFDTHDGVMKYVDGVAECPISEGQRLSLQEGYCLKVARGELPQCIPDTSRIPATQSIPATRSIPIGAHLSVPVMLSDGQLYGTLCCFSFRPLQSLGERDMQLMRAFGEILAIRFDEEESARRTREAQAKEIRDAIEQGAPRIVFQPICNVVGLDLRGFECLSRFDVEPRRPPDQWFALAHQGGVGLCLELHAIRKALRALPMLPRACTLSVNSSPELILSGRLDALLDEGHDFSRVILEITEHAAVQDYDALTAALAGFRRLGTRLAVDDVGAGYASMRHILNLAPEVIKLDMTLTQNVDRDRNRKALARGLTNFAHEIGSLVIAEGTERLPELETLEQLGVDCAQGYLLSRPLDLDAASNFAIAH